MIKLPRCLRPWTCLEFDDGTDNWGQVRPCCWSLENSESLVSENLMDIWNGDIFIKFRKRMLSGDLDGLCPPTCQNLQEESTEKRLYLSGLLRSHRKNDFLNFLEIIQGKHILNSTPVYMKLSPSVACNYRCIMCYQSHDKVKSLSNSTLEQIIKLLPNVRLLRLQGGEIFADCDGISFLKRLASLSNPIKIGLITNGSFPIQGGLDLLQKLDCEWLIISLDASTPETYEKIRIGGDWIQVMHHVDKISSILTNGRYKIKLYFSMTIMTLNINEVHSFLELACRYNADAIFNPLIADEHMQPLDPFTNQSTRNLLKSKLHDGLIYARSARMFTAENTIRIMLSILDKPLLD
jgi:sulfatase maturation enzyme AslB (radical SAM superfamily)